MTASEKLQFIDFLSKFVDKEGNYSYLDQINKVINELSNQPLSYDWNIPSIPYQQLYYPITCTPTIDPFWKNPIVYNTNENSQEIKSTFTNN